MEEYAYIHMQFPLIFCLVSPSALFSSSHLPFLTISSTISRHPIYHLSPSNPLYLIIPFTTFSPCPISSIIFLPNHLLFLPSHLSFSHHLIYQFSYHPIYHPIYRFSHHPIHPSPSVAGIPTIKCNGAVESAAPGSTVMFSCVVRGYPAPKISWSVPTKERVSNNTKALPNSYYRSYPNTWNAMLSFRSYVHVNDSGRYELRAENEHGIATSSITLNVLRELHSRHTHVHVHTHTHTHACTRTCAHAHMHINICTPRTYMHTHTHIRTHTLTHMHTHTHTH